MSFYMLMGFTNRCKQCRNVCHEQHRLCATCARNNKRDEAQEKLIAYEQRCLSKGKMKSGHPATVHEHFGTNRYKMHKVSLKWVKNMRPTCVSSHDQPVKQHVEEFGCPRSQADFHGDNMRDDT